MRRSDPRLFAQTSSDSEVCTYICDDRQPPSPGMSANRLGSRCHDARLEFHSDQEPLTAQEEPKPIAAARAWVASVAHSLPFLEPLSGSHLSSAEKFAELALQVYLEQPSAMQGKLFYAGERQHEMESFLSALFHRASLSLSGPGPHGLHPPPSSLVSTVAEQIDLQGSGFLDVTQCLLLSDALMRLAEKPGGEDKLGPGMHRKGGATMGPFCAVSVAGAASPVLDERTPQGAVRVSQRLSQVS